MFMEIGLVPTNESCRLRPMAESKGPVVMAGLCSVAGGMGTGFAELPKGVSDGSS